MLRTADDVLEALHSRKAALQLSDALVDELAGLTAGHTNKAIGPARDKTPNLYTLMSLIGAMGAALVIVDDPESRIPRRWEKRLERSAHGNRSGISKAALRKARTILLSEWSAKANAKRWSRTTPKQRAAIVAKLNRARARKRRAH